MKNSFSDTIRSHGEETSTSPFPAGLLGRALADA